MKLLTYIPGFVKNKYFIAITVFCVVLLFLDKNDIFSQLDRGRELRGLQQSKAYYTTQLAAERKELEALKSNPATLEKYAREKYMMKKDGEELFIISENYEARKTATKN